MKRLIVLIAIISLIVLAIAYIAPELHLNFRSYMCYWTLCVLYPMGLSAMMVIVYCLIQSSAEDAEEAFIGISIMILSIVSILLTIALMAVGYQAMIKYW